MLPGDLVQVRIGRAATAWDRPVNVLESTAVAMLMRGSPVLVVQVVWSAPVHEIMVLLPGGGVGWLLADELQEVSAP